MNQVKVKKHTRKCKNGATTVKKHYRRSLSNQKARKKVLAPVLRGGASSGITKTQMRQALKEARHELAVTGKKDMASKVMFMADKGISGGKVEERDTMKGTLLKNTTKKAPINRYTPASTKVAATSNKKLGRPVGAKDSTKRKAKKVVSGINNMYRKTTAKSTPRISKFADHLANNAKGYYHALAD